MDIIKKIGQKIYDVAGHQGFLVEAQAVNQLVKKWSKNRESDKQRVVEIAHHIRNNGWVPPTMYAAVLPTEGLVCYDGNHRREAYRMLSPAMDKTLVILDVLKSHSDIYDAFQCINKSVPVSLIDTMIDHDSMKMKRDIEALVKEYETRFHGFVSTSTRCNTPRFNRDNLKDQFYRFLTDQEGTTVADLRVALGVLNDAYKNGVRAGAEHSRLKDRVLEKCEEEGLWLFAFRREISDVDLCWAVGAIRANLIQIE
jgi:hypothetical protein